MRWLVVSMVLASTVAQAQVEHRGQVWWLAFTQGKLGPVARAYFEAQPRVAFTPGRFDAVLLRGALGAEFAPGWSAWVGFGWIPGWSSDAADSIVTGEGRLYQQLQWIQTFGTLKLQVRARMEERLLSSVNGLLYRFRVMPRLMWTFHEATGLFLAVQDELFVNFNERLGSPPAGFDQNRAYVGLGWQATKALMLELGYLNQLVRRVDPLPLRMGHTVLLTTAYSF